MPVPDPRKDPQGYQRWLGGAKVLAERHYARALATQGPRVARIFKHSAEQLIEKGNPEYFNAIGRLKRMPVPIDEFLRSKEFIALDGGNPLMEFWPKVLPEVVALNPDVMAGEEPFHEALLGGATGTAKTHISMATNLYQLYLLTCFNEPQRLYRLSRVTPIVFMFMAVSQTVTNRVIYKPFREIFTQMAYTKRWVQFDKNKESTLDLDGNITVVPALASIQSMVGQAVIGGLLDEVNFMAVVEQSKLVPGPSGQGGKYDQAEEAYRNIIRRRKGRFTTRGVSFGTICVSSSTRYKDDFMDRRMREVVETEQKNIYVFRRKQYEMQEGLGKYSGKKIRVLIGTDRWPTRILKDDEGPGRHGLPENATVEMVPAEFETDFKTDPENALRDIIGVATDAITSFLPQRHHIVECILKGKAKGLKNWVNKDEVDLAQDGMPQWVEENMPPKEIRREPWHIHIDLSRANDRCGIAAARVVGFENRVVDDDPETVELVPQFECGLAVAIKPSAMQHIDIAEVRKWILQLVSIYGFNIEEITYDGFDSQESQQVLRKSGVRTREISVDRSSEPYKYLRTVIYAERLPMVDVELLRIELIKLEYLQQKDKVDHPPKGSKDVADALCGAVYGASTSRYVRSGGVLMDRDGRQVHTKPSRRERARVRPQGRPFRRR